MVLQHVERLLHHLDLPAPGHVSHELEPKSLTDGGLKDGKETVNFYDKAGKAADAAGKTNSIPPTSKHEKDAGEGNLTGMSLAADGNTLYLCGQGTDAKTWLLAADVKGKKLDLSLIPEISDELRDGHFLSLKHELPLNLSFDIIKNCWIK